MTRKTKNGILVDDLGVSNDAEKNLLYITECAKSVGVEVTEGTALSLGLVAMIMWKMRKKMARSCYTCNHHRCYSEIPCLAHDEWEPITKKRSEFAKAVKMFRDNYIVHDCPGYEWINKPISYALYKTWKYFDVHEKNRNEE